MIGIFGVLFLSYVLFWVWNRQRHHPILVTLLGILAVFFLFLFGVWIAYLNDYSKSRNFLGKIADYEAYVGVVESEVTRSTKSSKCILLVERVKSRGQWLACQGKVLIYMDTLFSEGESIAYGDELLIKGQADTILPPQNPGEFDYKRYLRFTNVYNRDYITGRTAIRVNEGKG
ncbi:MAG: DUF4131 domain-containing protein, partial [Cytophagales bacterium]|nr:DUF4131 domain-containing protein [Cytophagales bacterium]